METNKTRGWLTPGWLTLICVFVIMVVLCYGVLRSPEKIDWLNEVGEMTIEKLRVKDSEIDTAQIKKVEADEMAAQKAKIDSIEAKNAYVENAAVGEVNANKVNVKEANVDKANIKQADVEQARVKNLEVENAKICVSLIFLRKTVGLMPENIFSTDISVTKRCIIKANTRTNT